VKDTPLCIMKKYNKRFIGVLSGLLLICLFVFAAVPSLAADISEILTPSGRTLDEVLNDFEAYAEQAMEDWQVPGMAVAIVKDDRLVYARGFGVKEYEKNEPVTETTIFQIGSTSKAFTGALLAMLVDEGKINWNDRVIDHLPDFQMYDPWVTREFLVKDLMAQRSGLPGYEGDELTFFGFDRDHIIDSLRYFQPVSSFRSEFAYQNTLFLVVARLIEKISGKSWEDMLEERIFSPLGMEHSTSDISGYTFNRDAAHSHVLIDEDPVVISMDWPYHYWLYTYGPAGGINSNIIDMAEWLRFQLNHGTFEGQVLLTQEQVSYMHSPHTPVPSTGHNLSYSAYCQAWLRTRYQPYDLVWHDGGTAGMTSLVQLITEAGLGFVVLTNLSDHRLPHSLGFYLIDLYFGNPLRDWSRQHLDAQQPEEPLPEPLEAPPLPLHLYTGTYSNPVYGAAVVSEEDGNLKITVGPKEAVFHLLPWSRDTFIAEIPDSFTFISDTLINFHFYGEDRAQRFVIDFLNQAGCGEWVRKDR